ncbi:CDP-alcohol phosphatidyltransferase family protein [Saccharopolyspora endophytica]|uniref:CDP-alcohol phosphatidyltransferase family protein n=1 Tax=Saccharopolyspora endophytica TaxID=543886 RepID=A0ABS5DN85_9PSEU|nr:CDP-alcohol phosphatidyltransferase family protein [Saccharopolyspora endophytica]MBQ0927763.1 CDP-alcohol phosphatidyltransferase family protein [Saccharopolyspora endophytica]
MIELHRNTAEHLTWAAVQVCALGAVAATAGLGPAGWGAGIGCAIVTLVLLRRSMRRHDRTSLGHADRITLVRAALTAVIAALVVDGAGPAIIVALGVLALISDFLDGRLARRTGTVSVFGARLDMEVDAFLILVLSAHVAVAFGVWVLSIGVMRYVFVAASWVLPRLRGELPPSFARKTVAAVQGIVLVVASSGIVPHAGALVACALLALVWSFGRDVLWLSRSRT